MQALTVILLLLGSFKYALAASSLDWKSRSIYQVLTDRFALPDDSGTPCNTTLQQYCGGTFKGIMNHLDYIQGMGFTAIWISPVVSNIEGYSSTEGDAYHGYWAQDITTINSHFGTADDLVALSSAIHKRGMYLMVDVVINHMGSFGLPNATTFASYNPFNNASDYHPQCFITDYSNQTDVEQCWLGDSTVALADLNTESQDVVDTWYSWIQKLVSDYSIDGLRIDSVKHIRKDFWSGFQQAAGVYAVGEVLINDTTYAAPYTTELDAILDYPAWFALTQAFTSSSGNLSTLVNVSQATQSQYKNGAYSTASFLENHDQPRFASMTQDIALTKNALTWTFVTDAIPIMYYGTEQAYAGGAPPANREALWTTAYSTSNDLYSYAQTLNYVRKAAITFNTSFLTTNMIVSSPSSSTLAVQKPPVLALLSNTGSSGQSVTYDMPTAGYKANAALVDVVSCEPVSADAQGGVKMTSANAMPMVLLPKTALAKSGLCTSLDSENAATSGSPTRVSSHGLTVAAALGLLLAALLL